MPKALSDASQGLKRRRRALPRLREPASKEAPLPCPAKTQQPLCRSLCFRGHLRHYAAALHQLREGLQDLGQHRNAALYCSPDKGKSNDPCLTESMLKRGNSSW